MVKFRKGFTIIEVLVAATIAIVAMGGVIYIFKQSRGSVASSENRLTVLHQGRMLLEYLKRDLRSIYIDGSDSSTKLSVKKDGISFSKSYGDEETSQKIERVDYSFSSSDGTVTRDSDRSSTVIFGRKMVKIKSFSIQKEIIKEGYKSSLCFIVLVELVNRDDEKKDNFTIDEKIFPPGFRTINGESWLD